jgi:carbon starvation protein CstA
MTWFLGGILFLIVGYFIYGKIAEKIFLPDDRKTPAVDHPDGVDTLPLPQWKNMLIQLLNIAGVGPVIGVILGIKFGKIALLVIPVGCVLMGAVHDFVGGMMSLRNDGANLPRIVRKYLGGAYATVFSWVMAILLLLVVAVFINVPANLIDKTVLPSISFFWWAVAIIFAYYIAATLFPVDKIIGRVYPFFGALLIIGSIAIFAALVWCGFTDPAVFSDCEGFAGFQKGNPLFPCLFVTIACGIISGFHATQSPIVARTMTSERQARSTFFGMMVAEGIIAMIWAAAALAIYNIAPENLNLAGPVVLGNITTHFLGKWMGGVTVFAIVVLAVTSGDTALRSARLSISEMFRIDQISLVKRIVTTLPLILIVAALLWWSNLSAKSFSNLWNYFAWGNQMLAATTLMAGTVWLLREGKKLACCITLLPGMFMTSVIATFILWTPGTGGMPVGIVPGGLSLMLSVSISFAVSLSFAVWVIRQGNIR